MRIPQVLDYPTLRLKVDRDKALQLGITERDVTTSVLTSLSSSLIFSPSQWLDTRNGVSYSVAVQTPQHIVNSIQAIGRTPLTASQFDGTLPPPQFLDNVSALNHEVQAQGINHYTVQRVVDVDCGVEGADLGSVTNAVQKKIDALKDLPPGTSIKIQGESDAMRQSFSSMGSGLILAIILVYLLMATNFQSWLDPMIIMMAVPGALAGVLWMLVITRTTLNVESYDGCDHGGGCRRRQRQFADHFRQRPARARPRSCFGGNPGGRDSIAPGHHDGACDDSRHAADVVGFGAGGSRTRRWAAL